MPIGHKLGTPDSEEKHPVTGTVRAIACPRIEVVLSDGSKVEIDPLPALRAENVCLDPEIPATISGLQMAIENFRLDSAWLKDPTYPVRGDPKLTVERLWAQTVRRCVEAGILR